MGAITLQKLINTGFHTNTNNINKTMKRSRRKHKTTLVAPVGAANRDNSTNNSPTDEYTVRYASNWARISLQCRESTGNRCCFPECNRPAEEAHHALYWDREGAIAGREIVSVHVFPLCNVHHSRDHKNGAHNWRNWVKAYKDPVLGNRNTASFYKKLRQGWMEKNQLVVGECYPLNSGQ